MSNKPGTNVCPQTVNIDHAKLSKEMAHPIRVNHFLCLILRIIFKLVVRRDCYFGDAASGVSDKVPGSTKTLEETLHSFGLTGDEKYPNESSKPTYGPYLLDRVPRLARSGVASRYAETAVLRCDIVDPVGSGPKRPSCDF